MKKLISIMIILSMMLSLGVMACAAEADYKEEIHVAIKSNPSTLDIIMTTEDVASNVAQGTIFEQLVTMDGSYTPVCELAESIEINDDATEYIYHLRQGVMFHNGEEMTAADVVASMNRWIDTASNAQAMVGEARFEEVDTYTVRISPDASAPYLNEAIAGLGNRSVIMPKSVIDNADSDSGLVKDYIGTGPYMLDTWADDQYLKLVRNDSYQPYGTEGTYSGWGGYKHAYTPVIYFDVVADAGTIIAGLQTGEYDIAFDISYDSIPMFSYNDDFETVRTLGEESMMIFNKRSNSFGGQAIYRQAVQAAVNCNDVMLAAYSAEDNYELYSSYMFKEQAAWYTEAGSEYFNQNSAERCQEILAQAGYNGTDPFRLLVSSDNQDFYKMAVVIKSQLDAAGFPCEILAYDWATFVNIRNNEPDQYDAFITSFSPKVLPTMNLYLSSSWAGWCEDAHIQETLSAINSEPDKDTAVEMWVALQQYMYEEYVPVVKLGSNMRYMIAAAGFEGLEFFEKPVVVNAGLPE